MIVKIVKIFLALSLVLWAVWGHFQGGSLCLTSSVCWSLQCLVSALTQWGRWWTLFFFFFLGSLVQLRCGEGGMLQTNNTGVCLQCLSPAGPAPAHGAHRSGSMLLCWEPSEAGRRLHAPPRSKLLRLGSRVVLRGADSVGPAFCALPRTEQLRCLASAVAVTYRLSLLLSVLDVPLAPLVRHVVTVQNPKKS